MGHFSALHFGGRTAIAPAAPGLCTVQFSVLDMGVPVEGAHVHVWLEDKTSTVPTSLLSRKEFSGTTNASGVLNVDMIQFSQFTRGGVYRIDVADPQGRFLYRRRVIIPTLNSVHAEDLPDADA